MEAHLTRGAVALIWEHEAETALAELEPVLQVVGVRPCPYAPGGYAARLSDGDYFISRVLPPSEAASADVGTGRLCKGSVVRVLEFEGRRSRLCQKGRVFDKGDGGDVAATYNADATVTSHLNHLFKERQIRYGTIVRILEFTYNNVLSPSMIVVIQLEVLQTECELIGRPKAYELCCIGKPYGLQIKCGEPYYESVADYAQPENAPFCGGTGSEWHLTQGAVVAMLESDMAVEQQLVMQVVDVSLVSQTNYRYRVLLSDGTHKGHAILFPSLNPLVEGGSLCNGTIVCILNCHCDTSQNYRVIFVQLEVLQTECELIGSPTFYEPGIRRNEVDADFSAPAPPAKNEFMQENSASSGGQSYPTYKATPD